MYLANLHSLWILCAGLSGLLLGIVLSNVRGWRRTVRTQEPSALNAYTARVDLALRFVTAVVGAVAAIWAIVFGITQNQNSRAMVAVAEANLHVARVTAKNGLTPALLSIDPKQRAIALSLAKAIDPVFAAEVANVLALADASGEVRQVASATLETLARSKSPEVQELAGKGLTRYAVMNELRSKGFLQDLRDAQRWASGGAPNGDEEALKIYDAVVARLSPKARAALNQELLALAERRERKGLLEEAAQAYQGVFADFNEVPNEG